MPVKKRTKEDKQWSEEVRQFWNNCCAVCGSSMHLNAHHLIPKEIKEFRYDLGNGIALCPKHHRLSFKLSAHQAPLAFFAWFERTYPSWYEKLKEKIKTIND